MFIFMSGIIPARAGSTHPYQTKARETPDHPRSRGVYRKRHVNTNGRTGSSPLARGLQVQWRDAAAPSGIIPARAGSTKGKPREHLLPGGSSPLARGLPRHHRRSRCCRRIIPARAGSTSGVGLNSAFAADHPRSRGVYLAALAGRAGFSGSSPLARGLRGLPGRSPAGGRIIPARAGSTAEVAEEDRLSGDHPRSRGVYTMTASVSSIFAGSSPLARGLRPRGDLLADLDGIIPARAGSTLLWLELNKMAFCGSCCGIPGWRLRRVCYKIVSCRST